MSLVESGIIEEERGVELIDGQIIATPSQGKPHYLICRALQRAFAAMGAVERGLSIGHTLIVAEGETYDPEFVLLRPEYAERELPRAEDVLWVVEVSVTSRRIDLGPKKAAYARAGIPHYGVVDAVKGGIWAFSDPAEGSYDTDRFFAAGEKVPVPILGTTLDTASLFPAG